MTCLKITLGDCQESYSPCFNHNGREIEWVELSEFLPQIRLIAKDVPDDIALEYINQSAIRFCKATKILKRRTVIDLQKGVKDYYIQAHPNENIWRADTASEEYEFIPLDKLFLKHTPCQDTPNGLIFRYTALPSQNACKLDKILYDYHHSSIVDGALSELLLMRKYDFADPQLAGFYEQKFKKGIHHALNDLYKEYNHQSQNFNGGRNQFFKMKGKV